MTQNNLQRVIALIELANQETIWVPLSLQKRAFEEVIKFSGLLVNEEERVEMEAFWDAYGKKKWPESKNMDEIIQDYKLKIQRQSK